MPYEPPASTPGLVLRSVTFNVVFYLNLIAFLVLGAGFFLAPRLWAIRALQFWARSSLWWLKVICAIDVEFRGTEHLSSKASLVVGKHQSLWETFALLTVVEDPAIVLKRELTFIPLFGWFAIKFAMIAVDRGAGSKALRSLIARAKACVRQNRQILIFPEGTRSSIGAEPDYKPGAAALYLQLGVRAVPFGLNSGLYWPRRKLLRYPGTIIVEFYPAIEAGLNRKAFSRLVQDQIEEITDRLVEEGIRKDFS